MKLLCLNIEESKHIDRVIPFFQKNSADIVCLQEACEKDIDQLKSSLYPYHIFAPMFFKSSLDTYLGLLILSKFPIENPKLSYYEGSISYIPKDPMDPNNINRVLLSAEIEGLKIATTHFTWSSEGETTQLQKDTFEKLRPLLLQLGESVICGDFNIPRGKEMYQEFTKLYKDNIPFHVTTTIDQNLHKVKGIQLVVDYIFSTPSYHVSDVNIHDGVSDHQAIIANITLNSH